MTMKNTIKNMSDTLMTSMGMHENAIDLDAQLVQYCDAMEAGLNGEGGLPMVPSFIPGSLEPKKGKVVIAIDVGGTNLRIALFRLNQHNRLRMNRLNFFDLPGRKHSVSAEQFFDILAGYVEPYLAFTRKISFSFAHGIVQMPDHDGYVEFLSKELVIKGLPHVRLGEGLKKALSLRGFADTNVIVFNDTIGVATSLVNASHRYDGFIGLVTGTGANTCYVERSHNIGKLANPHEQTMFINVESGEYNGMPSGEADKRLDRASEQSGSGQLEKMISGGYVGQLFWQAVNFAIERGMMSEGFTKAFERTQPLDTKDFSRFMHILPKSNRYSQMCCSIKDRILLKAIGTMLIKRGAKLIALEIAGSAVRSGGGKSSNCPICVISEGTTYYSLPGLKKEVERLISGWLKTKGIHVKLKRVDNAALKGIGLIGLSML